MTLESVVEFIVNPVFPNWFLILKLVFLGLDLFFMLFIIFAILKTDWYTKLAWDDLFEFFTYKYIGLAPMERKWKSIKDRFVKATEPEIKLAIIEADEFLNDVFFRLNVSGATLGERLESIDTGFLKNLEDVRRAHKVRSNIVHDPSYHLELESAKAVFKIYEDALSNLEAI